MQDICRTCGETVLNEHATNLYEEGQCLLRKIKLITGLWLKNEFDMPALICANCEDRLNKALAFRKQCIQTQKYLIYQNEMVEYDPKDPLNEESHIDNENEAAEEIPPDASHNFEENAPSIIEERLECSDNEIYEEEDKQHPSDSEENGNEDDDFDAYFKEQPKKRRKFINWKNITKDEARELKRMKRIGNYMCDKCSISFNCLSNFKLHELRHTGIKKFQCNTCDAKFYTNSLLRQHERAHITPFQCNYCEQTFSFNSSRVRHERIHTNERPYKCRYCEKAFIDSSKCKNHELIHTGERNYHCDVCNKRFSYSKLLRAHQATNSHKRMLEQLSEDPLTNHS